MGGVCRRSESWAWLRALSLIFFLAGLLLAATWDADGNANTDNLPQATFTIESRSVQNTAEASDSTDGDGSPLLIRRPLRRPRPLQRFLREWIWRFVAVRSRGP